MKYHIIAHTRGEKPHICEQCKKTFRKKNNLMNHMAIHTNERSFKYPQCQRSFKLSYKLKRHLESHLKNICKMCSKKFRQASSLKKYILYYKSKHTTIHIQEIHKQSEEENVALEESELGVDLEEGEV